MTQRPSHLRQSRARLVPRGASGAARGGRGEGLSEDGWEKRERNRKNSGQLVNKRRGGRETGLSRTKPPL